MRSNSILAILLSVILIVPILGVISTTPVLASTGQPKIGVVDSITATPTVTLANFNVSMRLDSPTVEALDGDTGFSGQYFAIIFYQDDWLVTFSGSQFDLYISKNGYSEISDNDVKYAWTFNVADLDATFPKAVNVSTPLGTRTFYVGEFDSGGVTYKVVVGPISAYVSSEYKYIKIFDGSVTSVAVTVQRVVILPTLIIEPTSGAAGIKATLKGTGFPANVVVEINYTSPYVSGRVGFYEVPENGSFTTTIIIPDLEQVWDGINDRDTVTFVANGTLASVDFTEYRRKLLQAKSLVYGASISPANLYNATASKLNVYVHDEVVIAGNYFNPTSPITIMIEGTTVKEVSANATGFFNTTIVVPELSMGDHDVYIWNGGVLYVFTITVNPTLELSPTSGYVGVTTVTCYAYGFPPNEDFYIWWHEKAYGDGKWYNLVNATTGSDGKFNVTVQFVVPHAYGGSHIVTATMDFSAPPVTNIAVLNSKANATFTVLPLLKVEPSEFENDGSVVEVVGTGFNPGVKYVINVDMSSFLPNVIREAVTTSAGTYYLDIPGIVEVNATGDLVIEFVAAGFRPGLHVIMLYGRSPVGTYTPAANATFYVKIGSDPVVEAILSALSPISSDIADIKVTLGAVERSCKSIETLLTGLSDDLAFTRETILAAIESARGDIIKAVQDVVPAVTEPILGSISSLESSLKGSIDSAVNAIQGSISSAHEDIVSAVSKLPGDISMYLTAIAILAALALLFSVISAVRVLRMK